MNLQKTVQRNSKGFIGVQRNTQKGFVGVMLAIFLLVAVVGGAIFAIGSYFSYANQGATIENTLDAKYEDNKNVMAGFSTKVKEIAQAAKLGVDAQAKLIEMANKSRYGADGSKATMQFIQEQNPNVDPSLYRTLQQVIESERTRFTNAQTEMLDIRRTYKTMLDKPYSGFWLHLAGYPKVDLKKYEIVINDYTNAAFTTHRAEAIDLSQ